MLRPVQLLIKSIVSSRWRHCPRPWCGISDRFCLLSVVVTERSWLILSQQVLTEAVVRCTRLHWRLTAAHRCVAAALACLALTHHPTLLRWYKTRKPLQHLPSYHGNCLPTDQLNHRWCMRALGLVSCCSCIHLICYSWDSSVHLLWN